jgi:tRNA A37 threonylcarbamoyladenosine synthetase subunit TsaC/SUA5/YrdC
VLAHIEEIENQYGHQVAWTIDAGEGGLMGSAVIDCTGEEPEILREGPSPIL